MKRKKPEEIEGRIVIKAGAGTGKTTVLVETFKNCLNKLLKNYNPEDASSKILALAFNKLAAKEIKERILKEFKEDLILRFSLSVSTIDSFCSNVLKEFSFYSGFSSDFKVLEEAESKLFFYKISEEALDRSDINIPDISEEKDISSILKDAYKFIQKKKSEGITPEEFSKKIKDEKEKFIAFLYSLYEEELKKKNFVDFSGLLLNVYEILRRNREVLRTLQSRYDYILVDEYQDTSPLQMKLLNLIAEKKGNYFVVGDIKQSIYGFRYVDPYNIEKEAEKTENVYELEKNFRSSKAIIDFVNEFFKDKFKGYKKLKTGKKDIKNIKPKVVIADSYEGEAEFIAKEIKKLVDEEGYSYSDFAIILRSIKTHASTYEKILMENGIPYYTLSGSGFYERDEIKDVINLLKFLTNPYDDIALLRVLCSPIFNFSLSELQGKIKNKEGALFEKIEIPDRLKNLMNLFSEIKDKERMSYVASRIINESSYFEVIKFLPESERKRRFSNIRKLLKLITKFESRNLYASFLDFFSYIKEIREQEVVESEEAISGEDSVTISTVHQVKGLEFKVVFVANINKQNFPSKNSSFKNIFFEEEKEKKKEEELRLFYVATTRAIERLYLLSIEDKKSRFIDEILKKEEFISKEFYRYRGSGEISYEVEEKEEDREFKKILDEEKSFVPSRDIKYLTVTKLSSFHFCPFFYALRYEFMYPFRKIEEEFEEIEFPVLGNAIHYVLERNVFLKNLKLENLMKQSEAYLNAVGISGNEKEPYMDKIKIMLENFIKSPLNSETPWACEVPVSIFLDEVEIKGTIDRVSTDFTIFDYKTGSKKFKNMYEFSMNLYRVMFEEVFNEKVKSLKLFYLKENEFEEIEIWDKEKTISLTKDYIKRIKEGNYNEKITSRCSLCPYKELCKKKELESLERR